MYNHLKKPYRSLLILSLFVVTLLIMSACQKKSSNEVHIGYFNNITHAQALYMKSTGSLQEAFKESPYADREIRWTAFNAGPSEIEALFSGDIDIGYIGPVPAIMANIRSEGDVTVLSCASEAGAVFVTSSESGITSLKDCSGKTISVPQIGNTQHLCLLKLLKDAGLEARDSGGDVKVIAVENADVQNLMANGQIDAALVPEPWGSVLESEGAKVLLDYDQVYRDGQYPVAVVVVRNDYLEENPQVVKTFLQEHERVTDYMNRNPDQASRIVNEELRQATGKSFDSQILQKAFGRLTLSVDVSKEAMEEFYMIALDQKFVTGTCENLYTGIEKNDDSIK